MSAPRFALVAALLVGCAAPALPGKAPAPPAPAPAVIPEQDPLAVLFSAAAVADEERAIALLEDRLRARPEHPNRAPRQPVRAAQFRVDDLPLLSIPAPLWGVTAPTEATGDEATEFLVDWKSSSWPQGPGKHPGPQVAVRVSIEGRGYGRIHVGGLESAFGPGGIGGVMVDCGGPDTGPRKLVPARWEVLSLSLHGSVEFRVTDAWLDTRTCTARVANRASIAPAPLAGGVLRAFRQTCASCADPAISLTVMGPRLDNVSVTGLGGEPTTSTGYLTQVSLPLRHGGGASVLGRVNPTQIAEWGGNLGVLVPLTKSPIVVGLEVVQGVADPEPVAIAYTGTTPN